MGERVSSELLICHWSSLPVWWRYFLHLCLHFPLNARGTGLTAHSYDKTKEVIWKKHYGRKMWGYFNFRVTKRSIWKKHSHKTLYLKHLLYQLSGLQPYNLIHLEKWLILPFKVQVLLNGERHVVDFTDTKTCVSSRASYRKQKVQDCPSQEDTPQQLCARRWPVFIIFLN